jgi:succinyl-diaminopimelate desuccinylase
MLSIATVIPPGQNYTRFSDYTSELMKSLGMNVRVEKVPRHEVLRYYPDYVNSPRYIILGRIGHGPPVLHFNGHYDVVPAGEGWSHDPFSSRSFGDLVYGRGAADMKGGIASILLAIKTLVHSSSKKMKGTIEVSFTPDEEIGGHTGVEYMLAKHLSKPNYVLIAEPTGIDKILVGHKGAFQALVEIYGKSAHGSMPWTGKNTFDAMTRFAAVFRKRYSAMIRGRISDLRYSDRKSKRPTFMLGGILRGGSQQNLIPSYSAFSVDRRLIPEENIVRVQREFVRCVNTVKCKVLGSDFKLTLKILNKVKPAAISPKSELVLTVERVIRSVSGKYPKLEMAVGTMDIGHFINRGIQAVAYGPGQLYQAHVADEHISMRDVVLVSQVYKVLAEECLTMDN